MALRALATYAEADTNRRLYNIRFNVRATAHNEDFPEIDFNSKNWQDAQFLNVSKATNNGIDLYIDNFDFFNIITVCNIAD